MENSLLEILTYYVIGGALLIGAPGSFFLIVFMPALQNTNGRMVGYKDHKPVSYTHLTLPPTRNV